MKFNGQKILSIFPSSSHEMIETLYIIASTLGFPRKIAPTIIVEPCTWCTPKFIGYKIWDQAGLDAGNDILLSVYNAGQKLCKPHFFENH